MADISYDHVSVMRLKRGREDKFWSAELRGTRLLIISGDTGTLGQSETKTFPTANDALNALKDQEFANEQRGYYGVRPKELDELRAPRPPTASEDVPARKKVADSWTASREQYQTSPVTRRPLTRPTPTPSIRAEREGPYQRSLTGPNTFIPKFGPPATQVQGDDLPRATSGGRPILMEGQPWPVCGYCDGGPLGLYLQFDIEERFMLAFAPGSHFLLFHCTHCDAFPDMPRDFTLPQGWLDPGHQSSYRIILNPPDAREVAHPVDPNMREQHLTFSSTKERAANKAVEGVVGKRKFKIGGLPHWIQPPVYPKCSCGAAMGFVLQVPSVESPGWATPDGRAAPFEDGLDAFLFSCSVQSHPYAGLMIVQR